MDKNIQKLSDFGAERHDCKATREGDWIIYRCTSCSYQRKTHIKTGVMRKVAGNPMALHSGAYRDPVFFANRVEMN